MAARRMWASVGLLAIGLSALCGCVDVPAPAPIVPAEAGPRTDAGVTADADPIVEPAADGDSERPRAEPCANCPEGFVCVGGQCAACAPDSHLGCLADSAQPICDAGSLACRGCREGECRGGYCLDDGRCAECDPGDGRGCGDPARPFCGTMGVCRGCADDVECAAVGRPPICDTVTGICRLCLESTDRGCDPTGRSPICEADSCRACADDGECGENRMCLDGRCRGCNPVDNNGCDVMGPTPTCIDGDCVPCARNRDCPTEPFGRCVEGRCRACNPVTHGGCNPDSQRPLCLDGDCVACGDAGGVCGQLDPPRALCLGNGRCGDCDPADGSGCDRLSDRPACDAASLTCVGCREDVDCGDAFCDPAAGGRCVGCVAGTSTGCDARSDTPICDGQSWTCGPCAEDEQCAGNLAGPECDRDGFCGCSDDEQCAGNPVGIHCHGAGDCGCHRDDQCIPGYVCVDPYCVPG